MELQKIDSIAALQKEKQRLQEEVNTAKHFLTQKTQQTIWNTKSKAAQKLAWPNLLQTGLKLGLGAVTTKELATTRPHSPTWLRGLSEGLAIAESEDPQKWVKLIPLALELWQDGVASSE